MARGYFQAKKPPIICNQSMSNNSSTQTNTTNNLADTSSTELEEITADTFFSNIPVVSAIIYDDELPTTTPAQIRHIPKITVTNPDSKSSFPSSDSFTGFPSEPSSREQLNAKITKKEADFVHFYVRSPHLITLQKVEEFLRGGRAKMENALMNEYDSLRVLLGKILFVVDCIFVLITIVKWILLGVFSPGGKDFWGIMGFVVWFSLLFAYRWPGYLRHYPGTYINGIFHMADISMNLMYFIPFTTSATLTDVLWFNIPTMIHSLFVFSVLYYIHHILWKDEILADNMFLHEMASAEGIMEQIKEGGKYRRLSFGWKSLLVVNILMIIEYVNIMQGYYSYALDYRSYIKYAYLCLAVLGQILMPVVFGVFSSHILVPWNVLHKKQHLYITSSKSKSCITQC
jgi:hypothetical protein